MTIADDRSSKRKRKREARKEFRRAVLARVKVPGGWKCERCNRFFRYADQIDAHHILPLSQGGSNCVTNGHALCSVIDPDRVNCHTVVELHLDVDDGLSPWWEWVVTRNEIGKQHE